MSKKNKKLKKQLRHNLIQQSQRREVGNVSEILTQEPSLAKADINKTVEPEKIEEVESVEEVEKEIKKILITVLILVAIIIGIYFLSIKTDFILTAGEWLTKVLNIKVGTN